jgi:flagellar biosynthetic protein FliR
MPSPDPTFWILKHAGAAVLVLARVSGLAWTAPVWGAAGLGWRVRLGLSLLLTALVAPVVGPELQVSSSPAIFARTCLADVIAGAMMGLSVALVLSAARQAGDLVGAQAGLSTASLYDPDVGDELTPLGHLYGLVALGVFLALGGPVQLVGTLVESYRAIPAGGLELTVDNVAFAFGRIDWALALALQAAVPAVLALMVSSLAMGLITRASPTLQLANLTLPVRTALGVLLVLAGLTALAATFSTAWWSVLELVVP